MPSRFTPLARWLSMGVIAVSTVTVVALLGGSIAPRLQDRGPGDDPKSPVAQPPARAVDTRFAFGSQYVPKFNEAKGIGAWDGTRDRGMAMHRDLGVQTSREGFIWRYYEPQVFGIRPALADFDDVVGRLDTAGIAVQAMVTDTPLWASTAPAPVAADPVTFKNAPPRGLYLPIFDDGTDRPGPRKRVNAANTFAHGIAHMATRYHGRVRYWQIWNEPDYPTGSLVRDFGDRRRSWSGSADDYVRLLRVGHTIVKWCDPTARVVTGGLGHPSYLQALLDRGAGAYFDQIDFHAYGWPGSETALAQFSRLQRELALVLARNAVPNKGMICSETGYTSLEPTVQADYIAKLYPTAIAVGVEATMYYANLNPCWKQMGLIDWRTMTQKTQGYWAYKTAATALGGATNVSPLQGPGLAGYRFGRTRDPALVVAWAPGRSAKSPLTASLTLPAGQWRVIDVVGQPKGLLDGGSVALLLTDSPTWLEADASRSYGQWRANPVVAR